MRHENRPARIRVLSALPPGSRVVVVPPEGSPEFEAMVDRAYRAACDAMIGPDPHKIEIEAALRALRTATNWTPQYRQQLD